MRRKIILVLLTGACRLPVAQAQSVDATQSAAPVPGAADVSAASSASAQPSAPTQQGGVADIIVTADRSAKTLQKTPIAVSVVTGSEITTQGRTKLDDVLQNVPAVIVQAAAKGFLISIRGLGDDLPAQNGQTSVSQNFDGVYNFRSESNSVGFYDLDRVEVLRGPQGTLYGRNASGGVVNIISSDPKLGEFGGYGTIGAGDYKLLQGEGAVNVPIGDTMAIRAAFATVNRDGYLSNGHDDNKASSGRIKFLYKPNGDVSLLLGVEYSKLGGKGPGGVDIANFVAGHHYLTSDTDVGGQNFRSWKFWAYVSAAFGPGVLTVLPAYQIAHAQALGAFGGNFADQGDPKNARQRLVEVRYASRTGARFQWNAGYYHYDNHNVQTTNETPCQALDGSVFIAPDGYTFKANGPPGPGSCLAEQVPIYPLPEVRNTFTDAIFGQITYPVTDRLRLIGGARYTGDRGNSKIKDPTVAATAPGNYVYAKYKDNHFEYRAGVEFDVAPRSLLYGTIARGHRTGGFNFNNQPFGPEKLTSYEIGSKNRFFDNRVQVNGDLFYYDYKGYQLTTFGLDCSSGACNPSVLFLNLPTARDYGAEVEGLFQATPVDLLSLSAVYLNAKLTSNSASTTLITSTQFDGARFPHAPRWTIKGTYSHSFDLNGFGTLTPRADIRHLSSQFVSPVPADASAGMLAEATQHAYTTGDLSLLLAAESGRWSANVYVKNINDKAIKSSDFFGYVQVQAPRTYGGTLTVKF